MDWEEFWGGIKRHRQKIAKLVEGKVAEVASGTARNFEYYQDEQFKFYRRKSYQESSGSNVARAQLISRVTFMDSSEAMLLIAAGKIKELNESKPEEYHVEPEFIKINCEDMKEIHENTYDTVVQTFGLCSTDRPESVLKEIERICKKNGKIILLEHGKSKYTWLNYVLNRRAPYHAKRWGCWHNKDIEKLVKDSGMSIELESRHHLGTTYFYVLRPNSC
ncbi:uncharacterized protein LOC135144502 [Zophobas morio]|uniref:uncharacterized protein LOC135144502 n=1 Tax=Zophobas morio TaxID=2755281 RepID=UPI0030837197